jgi:hypothetical protein
MSRPRAVTDGQQCFYRLASTIRTSLWFNRTKGAGDRPAAAGAAWNRAQWRNRAAPDVSARGYRYIAAGAK